MEPLTKSHIASLIKPRAADSHKGNYGHALLVAGSKGRMGAAVMAAIACMRTGAGLLTVDVPEEERFILQTSIPEAMLLFREAEKHDYAAFTAAGIGPAIGTSESAVAFFKNFLEHISLPLLLDADALNILSADKTLWELIPANTIITPHPKEFDRMFGESADVAERREKAINLSAQHQWVIVLKGSQTLVAADEKACYNTTGNAGLAKGGSGDVLTGMITALLAQGYDPFTAAQIGVFLHGLAADLAVKDQSPESLLATDVCQAIGAAFNWVTKEEGTLSY